MKRRNLSAFVRDIGPPAGCPTGASPGTPQKTAVLAARARRWEPLWHPEDARKSRDVIRRRVLAGIQWGIL